MHSTFNLIKLSQSIEDLINEGRQISAKLGKKALEDPRFQEILRILGNKGSRGQDAADELSGSLYREELISERDSAEQLAVERGQVLEHWSTQLLSKLNEVAYVKKGKILSDIYNFNIDPYKKCHNVSALRWSGYVAGKKVHNQLYRDAIEEVRNMTGNIFEMDDFFGYHPPIVATYYASHPEILNQISSAMHGRMLSYGVVPPAQIEPSYNAVVKYKERVLDSWIARSSNKGGIPLHWTTYRDSSNVSFTFGQMLIKDFTIRLAQEEPEAMCILFEKLYNYITLSVSRSMAKRKGQASSGDEDSDVLEFGSSEFSAAQSELVGNEQKRHTMESNLQYALDESVFSSNEKSFYHQAQFLEKYLDNFNSLLSTIDSNKDPESFKIILSLKNDLESAISIFMQQYVDALSNAYKYSIESKISKGINILDLSFDKMLKLNARKDGKTFIVIFKGANNYINLNAKFTDHGKKIKKDLIDISTGKSLGVQKELSLIEFSGLDVKISLKHMISITEKKENKSKNLLDDLMDLFDAYGDLNTPSENKKISQERFNQPFYSVRPELIDNYQQQNSISLLASICKDLFSTNPELIDKVLVGIKNTGSKGLSGSEKIAEWKKSFPKQYEVYEGIYIYVSNHLVSKLKSLQNNVNLKDDAIECFDTIGYPALVSEIQRLQNTLKTEPDDVKRKELLNSIQQHVEAQKSFNVIFSNMIRSDYKAYGDENVSAAWITSAVKMLWNQGSIDNLIDDAEYKEVMLPKIISYVQNLDDLQVIDLTATAYRGLTYNLTKKECMAVLPGMEKLLDRYGLKDGNEQAMAIYSLFSSACPVDMGPKTANYSYKLKTASDLDSSITDWIKTFGRKVYTE
jgi:hypothetical protein